MQRPEPPAPVPAATPAPAPAGDERKLAAERERADRAEAKLTDARKRATELESGLTPERGSQSRRGACRQPVPGDLLI